MSVLDQLEAHPIIEGSTWSTEWYIAWSQLRSRQHVVLLNITTLLAVLGVIAGVGVLNCVVAVMIGFEQDLEEKLIQSDAHVQITRIKGEIDDPSAVLQTVSGVEGVAGAAPYVEGEVMIRNAARSTGVIVKGIDPELMKGVSDLPSLLVNGPDGPLVDENGVPDLLGQAEVFDSLDDLIQPRRMGDALPAMFIGKTLQEQLQVLPGDEVQLINPVGQTIGMLGVPQPATKMFRVAGVFSAGQYEFDAKRVYVEVNLGRSLLQIQGASGIELKVADAEDLDRITTELREEVKGDLQVLDWRDLNRTLFEALFLQRYVMTLLLAMTVAVAALLIVSTLFMVVITKRSQIAILKAVGASNSSIRKVFIMHGSFVGLVGVIGGTLLGLVGCYGLQVYGWPIDADVYAMATLPVVIRPSNVISIAAGAFLATGLSTLLPASAAAKLDPVEGLRLD